LALPGLAVTDTASGTGLLEDCLLQQGQRWCIYLHVTLSGTFNPSVIVSKCHDQ